MSERRVRVAVVYGGRSSEHAISCVTAGSVLAAIDRDRYDVVPVGIGHDGRWVLTADDPASLALVDGRLPAVDGAGTPVLLAGDPTRTGGDLEPAAGGRNGPTELVGVDVVLPLLHGPYGEDGTLQGLLELAGLPYAGSGVLASAVAMDKHYMKIALAAAGLPVGPYVVLRPRDWTSDEGRADARERVAGLGWPVFVKPARAGSSIGISRVEGPEGLDAAVETAREHDPKVVVEAAIEGREVECGVLESPVDARPEPSVVAEIKVRGDHAFYDFEAKYLDGATDLDVPAQLPGPIAAQVRELAVEAFEALSCEGLARVDFFVRPDGSVVVNEVNTMPGFTPTSMFPRVWAATGVDYAALVDRLLQSALRRPRGLR